MDDAKIFYYSFINIVCLTSLKLSTAREFAPSHRYLVYKPLDFVSPHFTWQTCSIHFVVF